MIRPAVPEDLVAFAPMMREEDQWEVKAMSGLGPLEILSIGFFHSDNCSTGLTDDGEIVGIFGVNTVGPDEGAIWFLSSANVKKATRLILTEGKAWVAEQQAKYQTLGNVVSERNTLHQRLIKHMGFELLDPIDNYGVGRIRAIPFVRTKNV